MATHQTPDMPAAEKTVGDVPRAGDHVEMWSPMANFMGEGELIEATATSVRFMNEWFDGTKHDCTLALSEPLHRDPAGKCWYGMWDDEAPYETA